MKQMEATKLARKMKRIALPMVEAEEDWQRILEDVKDELNLEASEENRELIMDVIRDCENEVGNRYLHIYSGYPRIKA